jgi:hypothetical protein
LNIQTREEVNIIFITIEIHVDYTNTSSGKANLGSPYQFDFIRCKQSQPTTGNAMPIASCVLSQSNFATDGQSVSQSVSQSWR